MMGRRYVFIILLVMVAGILLTGCGSGSGPDTPANPDPITAADEWVISIQEQAIQKDFEDLPMVWTFELFATNPNESPYEGEFTGFAIIKSYCDMHSPGEPGKSEYSGEMKASQVSFTLSISDVAALTKRDDSLHPLIADVGAADFSATFNGPMLLSTHFIYYDSEGMVEHVNRPVLELDLNSHITQMYDRIFLTIEPFQWDSNFKLSYEGGISLGGTTLKPVAP